MADLNYMKNIYRLFIVVFAICVLCGCREKIERLREQIAIEGVESTKGSPMSGLTIGLRVRNDSSYTVTIPSASVQLYYMDNYICTAELDETALIPKRYNGSVSVKVKLDMPNPLKGLIIIRQLSKGDYSGFTCTLDAKVKIGVASRRLRLENIPLTEMLKKLGVK
ncbi:MAG: hypothetical protein KBS95_01280 [Alistipes sp.]|nr:hypothetical protein [Candidatus Alistipes equi]